MNIFEERKNYKPFEYSFITDPLINAMWAGHWTHNDFNFKSDIQDFKVNMNRDQQDALKRSLLMISQVEVAVKSYWSNIGKIIPKPEIGDMGAVFGGIECYDDQTEVLTLGGYKLFKDLMLDDKVATFDLADSSITFEIPSAIIDKPYRGKLHHYYGKATDLMITPKHSILVQHPQGDEFMLSSSESGIWSRNYKYPCSGKVLGNSEFTDLDRLLIAIQADGSLYGATPSGSKYRRTDVNFNLKKKTKIDRLISILDSLSIEYTSTTRTNGFSSINFNLKHLVDYDTILKIKSFDYIDINYINFNWGQKFIKELSKWDCSIRDTNITYYNSNERAIDKVSIIATLSGFSSNKSIGRTAADNLTRTLPQGGNPLTSKNSYVLSLVKKDTIVYPKRKEVEYDGRVYCVTVSTGAIIVRRNSRTMISGNCIHSRAYSEILDKLGFNDDFQALLSEGVVENRVRYLSKYVNKIYKNDHKNILYSLILFTLFTENVSLFSQFYLILAFNRFHNVMRDVSNVVQYTFREEDLHAKGGMALINQIVKENPSLMDEELIQRIIHEAHEALAAEDDIIDWILGDYTDEYVNPTIMKTFLRKRMNESLENIGLDFKFETDPDTMEKLTWIDEELYADTMTDFFHKKPTEYQKSMKSFTQDELF